ncbi:D-amino acid aminotransferase [Quisquiliibacterium transsilvanicum]|uniref:D-alanine transaminase n=1 Tax=Quisquiliibacterium transsilvanicum TaxID=1549638 RepID=A0A7W8HI59_9BURK|nr:D-amino acid aminotransferase [Quisquiliibacterium transsilvanicum]MBB5272499.1 D-alanine transaminase [Quisquiliibacterium transsilvanicum]
MSTEISQTVFLNGEFLPIGEARVPVLDRGFIFGDAIYEVVPVYGRRPFRWPAHLARLQRSLAKTRIPNPRDSTGWTALITEIVERHPWPDQFIYLQVTRGVARRDHAFPAHAVPTVFAMSSELPPVPAALREDGVAAITLPDERWLHCDIKSTSLLGNVLARQAAVDAGAAECVMFRDGFLTEGSASNIWVVRNGTIFGPPRDHLILEGIRCGLLDELCAAQGIPMDIRRITREEVLSADELLLSSATREVLAITRLDGKAVGAGRPGPVWASLHAAYQAAKSA